MRLIDTKEALRPVVFSFAVNDFFPIAFQHRQFLKHMTEPFEFVVMNDAFDPDMERAINAACEECGIRCVRVPQEASKANNPSGGYAMSLNWVVRCHAAEYGGIIAMVHSDVYPICPVSITRVVGDHMVATTAEFRIWNDQPITYMYPALTMINMPLVEPTEFDFHFPGGMDCGGNTRHFIAAHPTGVKLLPNHQILNFLQTLDEKDPMRAYYAADLAICRKHGLSAGWVADGFYHHMCGSQWNASSPKFAQGHRERLALFNEYNKMVDQLEAFKGIKEEA